MSSAMLMERSPMTAAPTFGMPAGAPTASPAASWSVLPRCEMKFEKCTGGFKMSCKCDDEMSCATMQNLCKMLCDGTCSCCCTMNGMTVFQCNLTMGMCKCDLTKDGCCITCTSGDKACCEMLQACCDCLSCCCKSGCCCYVCFNSTPICCGKC